MIQAPNAKVLAEISLAKGAAALQHDDLAGALAHYESAVATLQGFLDTCPSSAEHRNSLALSQMLVGDVLAEQDRLETAMERYDAALRIYQTLTAEGKDVDLDVLTVREHIADVLEKSGDREGAHRLYQEILVCHRRMLREDPDGGGRLYSLGACLIKSATLLGSGGGAATEALAQLREALPLWSRLLSAVSGDVDVLTLQAVTLDRIGGLLERQQDATGALSHLRQALTIRLRVVELAPDEPEYRVWLGLTHELLADHLSDHGAPEEALHHYEQCVEIWRGPMEAERGDFDLRERIDIVHHAIGELRKAWGDWRGAPKS